MRKKVRKRCPARAESRGHARARILAVKKKARVRREFEACSMLVAIE
jgi:hypothetical protein